MSASHGSSWVAAYRLQDGSRVSQHSFSLSGHACVLLSGAEWPYPVVLSNAVGKADVERALRQVLAVTPEGLAMARREIEVMRRLHHPCLLPLLVASVTPQADEEHGSKYVVHMLFPLYAVRASPHTLHAAELLIDAGPA